MTDKQVQDCKSLAKIRDIETILSKVRDGIENGASSDLITIELMNAHGVLTDLTAVYWGMALSDSKVQRMPSQ